MKKETVKWIVKALLAGLAAFAVLCALLMLGVANEKEVI